MKKVLLYVFGCHVLVVFSLLISHFFYKDSPKKKIVVHTFKQPDPPKVVTKAPLPKKVVAKPKKSASPKKVAPPKKVSPPQEKKPIVKAPVSPAKEDPAILEYGGALIAFFQESLDLPEYGEVKMKIEIDPSGKIFKTDVLESESTGNEEFLKKRLPELVCPCFNSQKTEKNTFEFTIVFKNR